MGSQSHNDKHSQGDTCVIEVSNIAPSATLEQMKTLFSFLGEIKEIALYPPEDSPVQTPSKICYLRYADSWSVGVAQHITNTVFIDRALIVVPVKDGTMPDPVTAMNLATAGGRIGSSNNGVISQITGIGGAQVITTIDPRLTALGLPQYPPLPANMDPAKIEEIRRTVYVGNLDSTISAEQLLKFFNTIGEVKFVRMAGDETQPTRFAFVEFTDQSSVANALQYNGVIFGGRPLKINHSNNAIVKPQPKSSEAAQKEIEEAMKRVREAQSLISATIETTGGYNSKPDKSDLEKEKDKRSRSRSHSRRSRSRSRDRRRSRSRDKDALRERDRDRDRGKKRRSRSRDRHRGRSRSHSRRSRTPSRRSRSRSRDRHRSKKSHRRSKTPERSSHRRSRSRDRDRERDRERSDRHRDRHREPDRDRERDRDKDRERDRERSSRRRRSHSRSEPRSSRHDERPSKSRDKIKSPRTPSGGDATPDHALEGTSQASEKMDMSPESTSDQYDRRSSMADEKSPRD